MYSMKNGQLLIKKTDRGAKTTKSLATLKGESGYIFWNPKSF